MSGQALNGRWHYRRSLASRVTILTTLAVGLSVAFVAFAAFMTARMQMQSTLDQSLLDRAEKVATYDVPLNVEVPSWALGAADIRILYFTSTGNYRTLLNEDTLKRVLR